ncbi:efflux RND transporter permease subunit [uncultured Shewanella sp.]|uniref:efflux RND transporter permease subunit n=1 Tax=uncultured Shewanella sp. TaxID=173975 RepID=UPI002630E8BA|nr:efflux RND transporter permease subunit [uncultured Shewanella sp.]
MKRIFYSKYFSLAFCIAILVLGLMSLYSNKIQLMPNIEPPKLSFQVLWPGMSEDFLIAEIVEPYESVILGKIKSIESLKVKTSDEKVSFEITLKYGSNLTEIENRLTALLTRTRPLPPNVRPIVFRHGGQNVSNRVVGSYFITSETGYFTDQQLDFIKNIALHQFNLVEGVESVELNPLLERELQIKLDMSKLFQMQMSFELVRDTVRNLLIQPVSRLYKNEDVITATFQRTETLESIRQLPISTVNGSIIRLNNIADISVKAIRTTASVRFDGKPAIAMRILRENTANLIEVQQSVDDILAQEQSVMAQAGLTYNLSFDTALFITRAISWVVTTLILGVALTTLVSFYFFKRLQPTILSCIITILSVFGIFIVLALTNTSINVISLAGITFATGMFVDGVLIYIEYLDRTSSADQVNEASIRASLNKLVPPLFASLLTTIVVFLPVVFGKGVEAQLFKGLSIAITSGLIFAFVLTVLLTPIFAIYFMPSRKAHTPREFGIKPVVKVVEFIVANQRRSRVVLGGVIFASLSALIVFFPALGYLPEVKRDAVDIYVPIASNKTMDSVNKNVVEPINEIIQSIPKHIEVKSDYVIGWPFFVTAGVRLNDNSLLTDLESYLKESLKNQLPQNRTIVMRGQLFGGVEGGNSIKVNLFVSDKSWLSQHISEMRSLIEKSIPGVALNIMPKLETQKTEFEFVANLPQLIQLNVTNIEMKNVVKALGESDFIGKWNSGDEVLNAYISIENTSSNISEIPYVASNGDRTYLGEMFTIEEFKKWASFDRLNGIPAATINLRITDKALSVSEVLAVLEKEIVPKLKEIIGAKGLVSIEGSVASLTKAKVFLLAMLLFSLVSFFVIISYTLKSMRNGIVVIFSLLPAIAGGVFGFHILALFTPADFNILTMLGFAIMLGIVSNNAILLIDSISRHSKDLNHSYAIVNGVKERFRAVLISSVTTIFASIPLLLFPSDASSIYQGIVAVIVGGIFTNLLTVTFVSASAANVLVVGRGDIAIMHPTQPTSLEKVA